MIKEKFFRKNQVIDDENINMDNVEVKNPTKVKIFERNWYNVGLIIIMVFLLLFATFSPVSEKWAYISQLCAFGIGIVDIAGEIIYRKKKSYALYNKVMVTLASVVFFFLGERVSAIVILIVYLICRTGIRILVKRQNLVFNKLNAILPDKAKIYIEGVETLMPVESIKAGNVVKVEMGDIIPCDGTVFEGKATLDESVLSEAQQVRRSVKNEDQVFAGCKVLSGKLQIVMNVSYDESYMAQSIECVRKVMEEKNTESIKFKRTAYTFLFIMWIAIIVVLGIGVFTDNFQEWLLRANVLLLATSVGSLRNIWQMAINYYILDSFKKGIIFKDKKIVEYLEKMDLVLIDEKITTGVKEYSLSHIHNIDCTKEEIMTYAGMLEYYSKKPVGRVIYDGFLQVARFEGLEEGDIIRPDVIADFNEFQGKGVSGYLGELFICVGNEKMMQLVNLRDLPVEDNKELVYVAVNQKLLGYIALDINFKGADNNFYEEWGEVDIEKIALYNHDDKDDYKAILKDMMLEKRKGSKLAAVTRDADQIKNLEGADFTILLDTRGKSNLDGDLRIPGKNLVEISELKMDLAGAVSMARLKCKGYGAVKIAFYGAAFAGIIPAWIPFIVEMLATILLNMSGDVKDASTDAEIR